MSAKVFKRVTDEGERCLVEYESDGDGWFGVTERGYGTEEEGTVEGIPAHWVDAAGERVTDSTLLEELEAFWSMDAQE